MVSGRQGSRTIASMGRAIQDALEPGEINLEPGAINNYSPRTRMSMSPTTDGFESALREQIHDNMADASTFNNRILPDNLHAISFPVESIYVAKTVPRVELMQRPDLHAMVARVSMDIAGQLNNALVQHLVKDCSKEELMRFKRSIIDEIKKRNQGERNEPDNN